MTTVVRFALLHSYLNFFPCFHLYFRESECSKLFHRQLLQKHGNLQNTREICAVWIIIDGWRTDLTVTLYLICRVLVFLGFLHQEEASVQVRIRFPHRIKRRWVSLFVTAAFLSVRMMSRLKISRYNYFWSILYQLSYINMQVTCKMTCFYYQLAESLLSAFLIIDCTFALPENSNYCCGTIAGKV